LKVLRAKGKALVVRLEQGEEVAECLVKACEEHKIRLGLVFGIGALSSATLFASASDKRLEPKAKELSEPLEIASASGNITVKEGKPYLHLHAVLGRADHCAVAGHLKRGVVSLTGEFFILELSGSVARKRNEALAMDLLDI
jgi:predicted DNA-binding protein with PD1-like motif